MTKEHSPVSREATLAGRTLAEWQAYAIDLHGKWRASEAALHEFRYPPCQALLRQVADEIDCGNDCDNGHTEHDTNAFVCVKSESAEGCCFEKAEALRNFAKALDTAALSPVDGLGSVASLPVMTADEPATPLRGELLVELAACAAYFRESRTGAEAKDRADQFARKVIATAAALSEATTDTATGVKPGTAVPLGANQDKAPQDTASEAG